MSFLDDLKNAFMDGLEESNETNITNYDKRYDKIRDHIDLCMLDGHDIIVLTYNQFNGELRLAVSENNQLYVKDAIKACLAKFVAEEIDQFGNPIAKVH